MDRWQVHVLANHTTGRSSNGRVEHLHMLIGKTRRASHGFTNHKHY